MAKRDATTGEIVRRDFDGDSVASQHADPIATHISCERREDLVSALYTYAERGIGQQLYNRAFQLDRVLLPHEPKTLAISVWQPRQSRLQQGKILMRQRLVGQKVLVVGPGWLGSAAALAVQGEGAQVWTLRRSDSGQSTGVPIPLAGDVRHVVPGGPPTAPWEQALPSHLDHVVVTIAPGRRPNDDHASVYPAAVAGALALADRHHARSVLYTSSTGVYGGRDGRWVRETDALHAKDSRQGALIEAEARLASSAGGATGRTILRPAGLYGPGRDPAARYLSGVPSGDADVWTNFSWRDDVVAAIVAALDAPPAAGQCAVFNCTDGNPLRASVVARALGASQPLGEAVGMARSNQRVDSTALLATGWRPRMSTVLDGLEALGHPVDRRVLASTGTTA